MCGYLSWDGFYSSKIIGDANLHQCHDARLGIAIDDLSTPLKVLQNIIRYGPRSALTEGRFLQLAISEAQHSLTERRK